jgi:xylan 1,4-beta-xylosidase
MFGMLSGDLVQLTSSASVPVDEMLKSSVVGAPDVDGIATRGQNSLDILLWNYHDEDVTAPDIPVSITVAGLPAKTIHVARVLMDAEHSNAYAVWMKMGSPASPSPEQMAELQKRGSALEDLEEQTVKGSKAPLRLTLALRRQAVTLYRLTW